MKGLLDPGGSSSLQVENAALDWFTAAFSVVTLRGCRTTLAVRALMCAAAHVPI